MKLTCRSVYIQSSHKRHFIRLLNDDFGLLAGRAFWVRARGGSNNLAILSRRERTRVHSEEPPGRRLSLGGPKDISIPATVGYIRIISRLEEERLIVRFDGLSEMDVRDIAPFVKKIVARMRKEGFFDEGVALTSAVRGRGESVPTEYEKDNGKRPPKGEIVKRREKVKELASYPVEEISERLENLRFKSCSVATVNRDLKALGMVASRKPKHRQKGMIKK